MSTMTQYNKFDDVADSIRNGQRLQAYRQMSEIGAYDCANMLDYFSHELGDTDLALDAAKTFLRNIK